MDIFVTKISSGCNFEMALRLSSHFVPFHNGVRNYKAGAFPGYPFVSFPSCTAVARQRCSGGSDGACVM